MNQANKTSFVSKTLEGFRIQFRVIGALFLREIVTRYGRHNIGFLWLFVEPVLFTVGITILWTWAGTGKGTMSPAGFALTGYSSLVLWRNMVNKLSTAVPANIGLLYHRNVKVMDLLATRSVLEIGSVTVSLVMLTILYAGLGLMHLPEDPFLVIAAWFYLCWFVIGAGMIGAYLSALSEVFDRVWHVLMYLTLPLTGAFSMVAWVPPEAQKILLLSPLVHCVEMLRAGYFGPSIQPHYSVEFLLQVNSALLLVGLLLVRGIRRKLADES